MGGREVFVRCGGQGPQRAAGGGSPGLTAPLLRCGVWDCRPALPADAPGRSMRVCLEASHQAQMRFLPLLQTFCFLLWKLGGAQRLHELAWSPVPTGMALASWGGAHLLPRLP